MRRSTTSRYSDSTNDGSVLHTRARCTRRSNAHSVVATWGYRLIEPSPYRPSSVSSDNQLGKREFATPIVLALVFVGGFSWSLVCQNLGTLFSTPEIFLWLPAGIALIIHVSKSRIRDLAVILIGLSAILMLAHVIANHSRGLRFMLASAKLSVDSLTRFEFGRFFCFMYCWIWHCVLASWVFVFASKLFSYRSAREYKGDGGSRDET